MREGRHAFAWLTRPWGQIGVVAILTLGVVVSVAPADGAATDIASHVGRMVRGLVANSRNAVQISGTPAVGALFTSAQGQPTHHFCTASVVSSPHGDLAITAAHCVTNVSSTIVFVPGYHSGTEPYGAWTVTKIYVDQAWRDGSSQADDVAFLKLAQADTLVPIEDVTGGETLATKTAARQKIEVIGYPDGSEQPIACRNWTTEPMSGQLEFDCGGYTNGTSGGPFLADVNPATGQGNVVGVIGGYEEGGLTPAVSYSIRFDGRVASLYATAVAGG